MGPGSVCDARTRPGRDIRPVQARNHGNRGCYETPEQGAAGGPPGLGDGVLRDLEGIRRSGGDAQGEDGELGEHGVCGGGRGSVE